MLLLGRNATPAGESSLLPPFFGLFWDGPSLLDSPSPVLSIADGTPADDRAGSSIEGRTSARRGLEGGSSPGFRLSQATWQIAGATGDSSWEAEVALGQVDARRDVDWDSLAVRWDAPRRTAESVRVHVGRAWRFEGAVRQDEHGTGLGARVRAPIGRRLVLGASIGQEDLSGVLSLALLGYPSLELASETRARTWGGALSLLDLLGSDWSIEASHRSIAPRSTGDTARLEARGSAFSWSAAWTKDFRAGGFGLFAEWRHQSGDAATKGLVGSETRRFHAQDWSATGDAARIGARLRHASVVFHGFEFQGVALRGRFPEPFLAWNALDASPWAPMRQVLSNRSDHLDAQFRLRRAGASGRGRIAWRRLAVESGGDVSWWAIDGRAERVATTISLLPFDVKQTVELLASPRWRVVTLQPRLAASLDFGGWGRLRGAAEALVPVRSRRLAGSDARRSPQEPDPASEEQAYSGLWTVSGSWSRPF